MSVDAIVNQAEYKHEVLKVLAERLEKFVYARILSCIPRSSTLYCYVNAKNIFRKTKFNLAYGSK